jgi:hypothetical protein
MFDPMSKADGQLIIDSIKKYMLNSEQERAFRIIANHSVMEQPEKLRMYLGGMGGTGKSQVIKALMFFFGERKENHQFLVVAPTGSAAALFVKKSEYVNKNKSVSSKSDTTGFVAAKGTFPVGVDSSFKKHKLDDDDTNQVSKKFKTSEDSTAKSCGPQGFIWDSQNHTPRHNVRHISSFNPGTPAIPLENLAHLRWSPSPASIQISMLFAFR